MLVADIDLVVVVVVVVPCAACVFVVVILSDDAVGLVCLVVVPVSFGVVGFASVTVVLFVAAVVVVVGWVGFMVGVFKRNTNKKQNK